VIEPTNFNFLLLNLNQQTNTMPTMYQQEGRETRSDRMLKSAQALNQMGIAPPQMVGVDPNKMEDIAATERIAQLTANKPDPQMLAMLAGLVGQDPKMREGLIRKFAPGVLPEPTPAGQAAGLPALADLVQQGDLPEVPAQSVGVSGGQGSPSWLTTVAKSLPGLGQLLGVADLAGVTQPEQFGEANAMLSKDNRIIGYVDPKTGKPMDRYVPDSASVGPVQAGIASLKDMLRLPDFFAPQFKNKPTPLQQPAK
jgi:hypothetical protein